MADKCGNCGTEITEGGLIKSANRRISKEMVEGINSSGQHAFTDLCDKCGPPIERRLRAKIDAELNLHSEYIAKNIVDFPMMTIGQLPSHAKFKIKSMVTANVTVGTGFLSEFSQGLSDILGATNTDTGMAYKVNSGEATARSIIVKRAMNVGANCVIGVDVDYGTTLNNAATINMQGTAIFVDNLSEILHENEYDRAIKIGEAYAQARACRGRMRMLQEKWYY